MSAKNRDLNDKEKKVITFAKVAFNKTLAEFYFPPLSEPNFVFDYSNREGFYIDPIHRWQITMNLANCPVFLNDDDYINFFYAITLHEVSHYQIIPYDGFTNAKLLKAAMKHINETFAPIVVNLFSDLIIDTKLYAKHPKLISWELKTTYNHILEAHHKRMSDFSIFLFCVYEKLLKITLLKSKIPDELNLLAERAEEIISNKFEDESLWEKKVSKLALILQPLINVTFNLVDIKHKKRKNFVNKKSPAEENMYIEIPEDIIEIMDNPIESRNIDKLKPDNKDTLTQKAEDFAKETPYSEFGAPASQAGILLDLNPLATWYRGKAKDLIQIKIYEEKKGEELPIFPETWRLGDPIEELDITQTLLNSPIIIPNITTRKWVKREHDGIIREVQIPDLLLVIDSSGSMNWNYNKKHPTGTYHTALIAAFAALHFAAQKAIKFSVINFSNIADTCNWTSNYHLAEETLLRYQGGGTQLPLKAISNQCKIATNNVLVFIITDFGIYNWNASKKLFLTLTDQGHHVVGFFIGSSKIPKNKFKDLSKKVNLYPIKKDSDLINLVIREVRKYYF